MAYDYDIIIIGGGPGGYVAAIRGAQLGKKICLIEKEEKLGGVCLNQGCIPTKTIIKSVGVFNYVKKAADFGIKGINANDCFIDLNVVQNRKNQVVDRLTNGVAFLMSSNGVKVIKGTAAFESAHAVKVNGHKITGENMIIATGSLPANLPVPSEGKVPLMTSKEGLELTEVPGETVIIGGGVIGIEFAFILSQLGSKVTVLEMLDEILPAVDSELTQRVRAQLKNLGVDVYTKARVVKFEGDMVHFEHKEKNLSVKADKILAATGRKPSLEGLNHETAGIQGGRQGITVNSKMQTNIPHIYAIGDVTGQYMLAHVASMEGIAAVENICGYERKMDYSRVPQGIYIDPEIASVGMTEQEALSKGLDIKVGRFNYAANGKAVIEGAENGLIKVIVDKKIGEILGVHMMGVHATDMISESVLAMNLESTAEEIVQTIHPHPTVSEVIPEAFHAALHKAIHSV